MLGGLFYVTDISASLFSSLIRCKTDQAATLEELKRFMLRVRKLPGRIDEGDQIQVGLRGGGIYCVRACVRVCVRLCVSLV